MSRSPLAKISSQPSARATGYNGNGEVMEV
jgi:hypothetical protein